VTTKPRRAARRPTALAAVVALFCGAASACGSLSGEPERYTQACGVVLDGSGSAAANPSGFGAKAKLEEKLTPFLSDNKCRKVSFGPITRVSQASTCQVGTVDIDPDLPDTADREQVRKQERVLALAAAEKMLACAQKQEPGSDVLGGLSRIAQDRPSGDGAFDVLVVSDFDHNDPEFRLGRQDLSTAAKRDGVIDDLLSTHGTPDLKGADVYPVGYGMKYKTSVSRYQRFDAFWKELLEERVKAHVHTTYR
jgi:hypothetical protein